MGTDLLTVPLIFVNCKSLENNYTYDNNLNFILLVNQNKKKKQNRKSINSLIAIIMVNIVGYVYENIDYKLIFI